MIIKSWCKNSHSQYSLTQILCLHGETTDRVGALSQSSNYSTSLTVQITRIAETAANWIKFKTIKSFRCLDVSSHYLNSTYTKTVIFLVIKGFLVIPCFISKILSLDSTRLLTLSANCKAKDWRRLGSLRCITTVCVGSSNEALKHTQFTSKARK